MRKQNHMAMQTARVSVFDALLIRALINCGAGLDYESELADARELAGVVERKPRMRYVEDASLQPFGCTHPQLLTDNPNPTKKGPR